MQTQLRYKYLIGNFGKGVFRLHWVAKWVAEWKRLKTTGLNQILQTTTLGPNPAHEAISSGRKDFLSIMIK